MSDEKKCATQMGLQELVDRDLARREEIRGCVFCGGYEWQEVTCPTCNGGGTVCASHVPCPTCRGEQIIGLQCDHEKRWGDHPCDEHGAFDLMEHSSCPACAEWERQQEIESKERWIDGPR